MVSAENNSAGSNNIKLNKGGNKGGNKGWKKMGSKPILIIIKIGVINGSFATWSGEVKYCDYSNFGYSMRG